MVSVLPYTVLDLGFYIIGMCCFSDTHEAPRSVIKDWLSWSQDNVAFSKNHLTPNIVVMSYVLLLTWVNP